MHACSKRGQCGHVSDRWVCHANHAVDFAYHGAAADSGQWGGDVKVTRIAYSRDLNAGKYEQLVEQAKRLGRVRSLVWQRYGYE